MKSTPPADTTHLFLIRHGATDANLQRPYILQGKGINGPLSDQGRQQAAACGQRLADFPIQHVYASPMLRAQQTAAAIAAPHELSVGTAGNLNECDVGQWEGMDWETIEREYPEDFRKFRENPAGNGYVGGESYGDVADRVRPVISDLLAKHTGETIVIVGHNVVNRVYLAFLLGIPIERAPAIRQANCGINFIRHSPEETTVQMLNAMFHLDGLV